jgi:O-antigen ligase
MGNSLYSKKVILFMGFFSLLFTFTNIIPLSLTFCFLVFLLPLLFLQQQSYPHLLIVTLGLYLYFFFWTLLYSPEAFLQYPFYRRDGNFFVSLMPMVIFGLLCLKVNVENVLKTFLTSVTAINFIVFLGHRLNPSFAGQFSEERSYYFFFFLTHNAAGGFLSILAAISIAFWMKKKNFLYFSCILINIITLYYTHSRGSLLALLAALIVYIKFKEKYTKLFVGMSVIFTMITLVIGYHYWNEMGRQESFMEKYESGTDELVDLDFERSWTVLDRVVFLWPRAIDLFLKSPIVGTGFGSFNDVPYNLKGVEYLVMMNFPEEYIYSDAHTHHSYLHILSETGVVGLFLVILMLVLMRNLFLNLNSKLLKDVFMLMFWVVVWSSMTEHRIFTPAQMLPFFLLVGFLVGNLRAHTSNDQVVILKPMKQQLYFSLPKKAFKVNLPTFKIKVRQ